MNGIDYRLATIPVPEKEELLASPFCFRADLPENGDDPLVRSVSTHGMINPPIMLAGSAENIMIVTGHRRLAAARAAGMEEAVVIFVTAAMRDAVAHWIEDAGSGAPLSDLEKIVLIEIAENLSGGIGTDLLAPLSSLFGREITLESAGRMRSLLGLDRDILTSMHGGDLSMGDLLALEQNPAIETRIAARLVAGGHLTRGSRKEAIRLISYLADQGDERLAGFIEDPGAESSPLLQRLRAACYPGMEKDLAAVRSVISGIGLPKGAVIHPPENLEGGGLQFTLRIRDEKETGIAADKLKKAVVDGSIARLLDILGGKGGKGI